MQLFQSINQHNRAYLDNLPCVCEQNTEDLRATWVCPRHGYREPRYDILNGRGSEYDCLRGV
jgi:hypothetical protein